MLSDAYTGFRSNNTNKWNAQELLFCILCDDNRSNNTNKWNAQELRDLCMLQFVDQIIPINGMLKNRSNTLFLNQHDQIIPINGMLKNNLFGMIHHLTIK